jgi:hypothetical protein
MVAEKAPGLIEGWVEQIQYFTIPTLENFSWFLWKAESGTLAMLLIHPESTQGNW